MLKSWSRAQYFEKRGWLMLTITPYGKVFFLKKINYSRFSLMWKWHLARLPCSHDSIAFAIMQSTTKVTRTVCFVQDQRFLYLMQKSCMIAQVELCAAAHLTNIAYKKNCVILVSNQQLLFQLLSSCQLQRYIIYNDIIFHIIFYIRETQNSVDDH